MNFFLKKVLFLIFLVAIGLFALAYGNDYDGKTIVKINVEGNESIKAEQIIAYFNLQEGDIFVSREIQKSFKEIFEAGFLKDIKVDVTQNSQDQLIITFIVRENIKIGKIFFVGNEAFTDGKLEEGISIGKFAYFESSLVNESRFSIIRQYLEKGYLDVEVDYVVDNIEGKDEANITFLIREGARYLVKEINFYGNSNVNSELLLKSMNLKLDSFFSSGYFDPYRLQVDQDRIEYQLRDNGYYKGKIIDVSLTYQWREGSNKRDKDVIINIELEQGQQYFFGDFIIKGNTLFSLEEFFHDFRRKPGEVFRQSIHDSDLRSIYKKYQENGYIFVRITPIETINEEDLTIDFLLDIYEGDKAHIENIYIEGLSKTKEDVARRELVIEEGEIFDVAKIQASIFNLNRLDFFSKIEPDYRSGSTEGLMNLFILLREKNTGFISGGFSYSFSTGFALSTEVKERNFLGLGHEISVKANIGLVLKDLDFSYVEPWLLGHRISLGGNFKISKKYINYYTDNNGKKNYGGSTTVTSPDGGDRGFVNNSSDSIQYTQDRIDLGVFSGQRFGTWWTVSEGLSIIWIREYLQKFKLWPEKYNQHELYEYNKDLFNKVPPIDDNLITLKLRLGITYDSRDNILSPSTGVYSSFNADLYFFGYSLIIWSFDTGLFKSIAWRADAFPDLLWKLTFSYKFSFKTLGQSLIGDFKARTSLYFNIKNTDVRGWEYAHILSYLRENGGDGRLLDEKPYGQSVFHQNFEILQNFGFDLLQLVYFIDMGNISPTQFNIIDSSSWNFLFDWKKFLYSTGFGFKLNFSQFPMRLYFAWRFIYDDKRKTLVGYQNPPYNVGGSTYKPTIVFDIQGFF